MRMKQNLKLLLNISLVVFCLLSSLYLAGSVGVSDVLSTLSMILSIPGLLVGSLFFWDQIAGRGHGTDYTLLISYIFSLPIYIAFSYFLLRRKDLRAKETIS